jgi:hypothetical protein
MSAAKESTSTSTYLFGILLAVTLTAICIVHPDYAPVTKDQTKGRLPIDQALYQRAAQGEPYDVLIDSLTRNVGSDAWFTPWTAVRLNLRQSPTTVLRWRICPLLSL